MKNLFKSGAGVAAIVVMRCIVMAPHPRHRRYRHDEPSARRQLPAKAFETGNVILDMLDDVECRDDVETTRGVRNRIRQAAVLDVYAKLSAGNLPRFRIDLEGFEAPKFRQRLEVATGSATRFKKPQPVDTGSVALDDRLQNASTRAEPPVLTLEFIETVVDVAFHSACSMAVVCGMPRVSLTR